MMTRSPTSGPYGVLKAAWHTDRIDKMRRGEVAAPVSIQLILSDFCNQSCHFCAYRAPDGLSVEQFGVVEPDGTLNPNPKRMIATAKATEIINDAAELGVRSITFTGGGEPSAHPDHLSLFALAMGRGLECSLNTNGMVFRRGWEAVLPHMQYVRFSIDAGTSEEYARIRSVPVTTYDRVLEHVDALVREVVSQGTDCVVGAGYVVTPENHVNLREGVLRIRDTGARYVRLASMQSTLGPAVYGDQWQRAREAVASALSLGTETFEVVNLFDVAQGRRMADPFCGFQELVTYIGANLKVYRCCYTAYTALGEAGSLEHQTLADWMRSPERASYRQFDARSCGTCPLADKNAVIGFMVNPQPTHVAFI